MVHSGVCLGFFVGQNGFGLKCQKSQLRLFQLSIKWWLSVCLTLLRWVLPTGCLRATFFFPKLLLPALATQLCTALAGTQKTLLLPPNPYTRGGLWVQNNQSKLPGRPSFDKTIFPEAGGEEIIF